MKLFLFKYTKKKKIEFYYKSPFNELYFLISPGLKYLGMNENEEKGKQNEGITTFNIIN